MDIGATLHIHAVFYIHRQLNTYAKYASAGHGGGRALRTCDTLATGDDGVNGIDVDIGEAGAGIVYVFWRTNFRSGRGLINAVGRGMRDCKSFCCCTVDVSSACVSLTVI